MVAQAAIPIVTAVGEFAAPYLIREATKLGIKKFIQNYGGTAFQAISAGVTGGIIAQETPPLDLQNEKLFGTSIGSLPGMPTSYYDDTTEKDKEQELSTEVKEEPPKLPEEPPKGPDIGTELATEAVVQTTKKLLEDKKPDISEQTKELVPEKPEFGKLTKTEIQTAKALKEGKPDFYSRVVESIKNAKPDKLTKTKWKSYIESTKDEMDYLGLTEFLQGNESITKKELLKFVEKKDIAPNITVRSIPKDQMNPLYERYSLGGDQEHIVFQVEPEFYDVKQGKKPTIDSYVFQEPHFDIKYGTNTFAHARVQVGFDEGFSAKYDDLSSEVIDKLKNTQIIDEIQSQWLQQGRIKGFVSDFDIVPENKLIEYLEKNNIFYKIKDSKTHVRDSREKKIEYQQSGPIKSGDAPRLDYLNVGYDQNFIFNKSDKTHYLTTGENIDPVEYLMREEDKVPDFPIKESKKWVELVLTKLIEKAILDGRDSIAITNGQIQYNRYPEMEEKKRQGLKKFYDTVVIDGSLEKKFADKYNVELERINLQDPEQALMDQEDIQMSMPRHVKTAQSAGYTLQKIPLDILEDLVNNRGVPGHASIYTNEGRGQGVDYILDNLKKSLDNFKHTDEMPEYYVWFKKPLSSYNITDDTGGHDLDILEEFKKIVWDIPIVPVEDAITNPAVKDILNASSEDREYILKQFTVGGAVGYPYEGDQINNIDLIKYTEYLRNYKPPEGVDLGYDKDAEQLIKMKLPKKLQKERLSKPIRLTKAKQQTDRLFA